MKIQGIIFLFLISFSIQAQFTDLKKSISLNGHSFINPGISYRLSRVVNQDTPILSIAAPRNSDFEASTTFSMYWDPFSHVAFQNYYNLEYDLRLIGNLYFDYGVGLGFQTNFTTDNYIVTDDFEVKRRWLNAHLYGLANIYAGIRFKNERTERSTFVRSNLFLLTPYNSFILPAISFSIGKTF